MYKSNINPMINSRFCIIFILSSLLFSINIFAQNEAYKLKNEDLGFSIEFPAEYILAESNEDNGLKNYLYKSEFESDVFMFKFTEHKNPAVTGENIFFMDASVESFVTGIKGTLLKKFNFKYGKTSGTEAFLSLDNKNLNVFYQVIIIDRIQYQIIAITKHDDKTKTIDTFFNSFICPLK